MAGWSSLASLPPFLDEPHRVTFVLASRVRESNHMIPPLGIGQSSSIAESPPRGQRPIARRGQSQAMWAESASAPAHSITRRSPTISTSVPISAQAETNLLEIHAASSGLASLV